jgi:leucyl/phenylalanyl-tRNA--protein transferase
LEFDRLHIPRSLKAVRRKSRFTYTIDQAFEDVIRACAKLPRPGQAGTWITTSMMKAYRDLNQQGWAHSVEVWEEATSAKRLIGGIYGVDVDGIFSGESMFHLRPNASKLALLHLIEHLRASGAEWMDIQMLTPHMEALGAREISRDDFLNRLDKGRAKCARPFLKK